MKKKYLKLTTNQKLRGVIFSSTLIPENEDQEAMRHEVLKGGGDRRGCEDAREMIKNLKDDSFFDESSYKYNLIRR